MATIARSPLPLSTKLSRATETNLELSLWSGKAGCRRLRQRHVRHALPGVTNSKQGKVRMSYILDSREGDVKAGDNEKSSPATGVRDTQIQLDMPRRRLQVSFTCNPCGSRTTRLVNPHAYRKGTVFVMCASCEKYHQLVDNLGLVTEYDFRKLVGEGEE
eukprot:jgi/Mesvir1/23982/Mv24123-RA.1